jgi:hypothetical protein
MRLNSRAHARPQSLEKHQRSRTRKSFAHGDLTAPVHRVDLHDSLGDVEPDHGNVHLDGSSVSDSDNHHSGTPVDLSLESGGLF